MRDNFASAMDEESAEEYEAEFNRAVACAYRASRWRSKTPEQGLVAAAATVRPPPPPPPLEAAAAEVPTAAGVGAAATHVVAAPAVIGRGIVVFRGPRSLRQHRPEDRPAGRSSGQALCRRDGTID